MVCREIYCLNAVQNSDHIGLASRKLRAVATKRQRDPNMCTKSARADRLGRRAPAMRQPATLSLAMLRPISSKDWISAAPLEAEKACDTPLAQV